MKESSPLVVLDPGHGGRDPGAVGPAGLRESDVVLSVARFAKMTLESCGARVKMTRDSNRFLKLSERARIANAAGADFFLSIHCNSATKPAQGIETWIARRTTVSFPFAESIQDALTESFPGLTDRGIKRANFTVLKETKMAAALAELAFIHTPAGELLLSDPVNQEEFGRALGLGTAEALGLEEKPFIQSDEGEPQPCACQDFASAVESQALALLQTVQTFEGA